MRPNRFRAIGALALVGALVAACGTSTLNYMYERQSAGTVTLAPETALYLFDDFNLGIANTAPEGGNAVFTIAGNVAGGNTVLKGKFSHGDVRFDFSGYILPNVDLIDGVDGGGVGDPCLIPIIGDVLCPNDVSLAEKLHLNSPSIQKGNPTVYNRWYRGGCDLWLTNYKSTNASIPDYGMALILVCDKAPNTSWFYWGEGEVPGDYVEVLLSSEYGSGYTYNGFYDGGFVSRGTVNNKWRLLDPGPMPSGSTFSSPPG